MNPRRLKSQNLSKAVAAILLCTLMSACGGGSSSNEREANSSNDGDTGGTPPPSGELTRIIIPGAPVKGPLANADVTAYAYNASRTSETKLSAPYSRGTTDNNGSISGVSIPSTVTGPVIIKIEANEQTIDLNTGETPKIEELFAIIDASDAGRPIYPSAATTLAYYMAANRAGSGSLNNLYPNLDNQLSVVSVEEFHAAYNAAIAQIASLVSPIAMDKAGEVTFTPPLVTDEIETREEQAIVLAQRIAAEMVATITITFHQNAVETRGSVDSSFDMSANDILRGLALDLSDGEIDHKQDGSALLEMAYVGDIDEILASLPTTKIPGTDYLLSDIDVLLVDETNDTGSTGEYSDLEKRNIPVVIPTFKRSSDVDGDGVPDSEDIQPTNPNAGGTEERPYELSLFASYGDAQETTDGSGNVLLPLQLNRVAQEPITITVTPVGGTAAYDKDYRLQNDQFTISQGSSKISILVIALDDEIVEDRETIELLIESEDIATPLKVVLGIQDKNTNTSNAPSDALITLLNKLESESPVTQVTGVYVDSSEWSASDLCKESSLSVGIVSGSVSPDGSLKGAYDLPGFAQGEAIFSKTNDTYQLDSGIESIQFGSVEISRSSNGDVAVKMINRENGKTLFRATNDQSEVEATCGE